MSPEKQTKRGPHGLKADFSVMPNSLYDEWIPRLNRAGFHGHGDVLSVIARKTIAWGHLIRPLGTPLLAADTGYSKQRICEILDELEAMGAIVRERPGNGKTTKLGIVLGWTADDGALERGLGTREERLQKKFKHSKNAAKTSAVDQPNLSTHTDRLEDEPVNSYGQVTCQPVRTGNLSTHADRSKNADRPEKPVNTRVSGDAADRLNKGKKEKETDSENQSISPLSEGETSPEPTDRPTSGGEDSSSLGEWKAAKDWRTIDALVEEKLGSVATDEERELGARVEELVGRRIPRRRIEALAGVVGSAGAGALVEAARRYETRRGIKSPWPYLLKTLLSAAEELGDEAASPDPAPAPQNREQRTDDGADGGAADDPGLRADLEAALGHALPRMFSGARLTRDEQGRKTVVARDGAHGRNIEKSWGSDLDAVGWRLTCVGEGSPEKKGEVA
ncbi:MAG: replication protein [Actinomycetota bacterium]|nr:replication protein [Actinomycetota bacterium]